MFRPDPPPRSKWLPPDWFVHQWNETHPGDYRTRLDPLLWDLWLAFSLKPVPPLLTLITGI